MNLKAVFPPLKTTIDLVNLSPTQTRLQAKLQEM